MSPHPSPSPPLPPYHYNSGLLIAEIRVWRGWRTYAEGAAAVMVRGGRHALRQAVLVHNPIGFLALGRLPTVEHQRLLDAHLAVAIAHVNGLVSPRRFPVAARGRSVGPGAIWVLPVPRREEIPLSLPEQRLVYRSISQSHLMSVVQTNLDQSKFISPSCIMIFLHMSSYESLLSNCDDRICKNIGM